MKHPLILIPTPPEFAVVAPRLVEAGIPPDHIRLCGFGLVAAAARTSQLTAQHRPDGVVLVGIAGSFTDDRPPGDALLFSAVTCVGIGAGGGTSHVSAGDMGWPQFAGTPRDGADALTIGDTIEIGSSVVGRAASRADRLLSVAAASANATEAARRGQKYPDAVAEDMEGYGVALACVLAGVPVEIVRGISNRAGDRDVTNWQINPALTVAANLTLELLAG